MGAGHQMKDFRYFRTLVQRIEIGRDVIKIVFRVMQDARGSGPESIIVTLPRMWARIGTANFSGSRDRRYRTGSCFRKNSQEQNSPYAGEHEAGVAVLGRVLRLEVSHTIKRWSLVTVRFRLGGPAGVWFVSEVHGCHIVPGVKSPATAMLERLASDRTRIQLLPDSPDHLVFA